MKKIFIILCLSSTLLHAQYAYWQQKVAYKMNIDFDASKHQFKGTQNLVYYNNSPDTLKKVFYHLYFNAFQPGSSMDVQSRQIADPDGRVKDRISKLSETEIGFHKILSLKQNKKEVKFEIQGTILEVTLNTPIPPKKKVVFDMEFESQVPIQIRRSGRNSREGIDYSMTQWYPKICEYDFQGWHTDPYVGREFYGVFGSFDITIAIDKKYVLASSGFIQNPQEVGAGYEDKSKPLKLPKGDKKIWKFKVNNVHDFAWAADPDYNHDIISVPNGPKLHFLFQSDDSFNNWKTIQPVMVKFFGWMETRFGKYPYEQFSFVQGGDGGMEYPLMTLVTSAGGKVEGLIGVCFHEAIHNWYYGVIATNESKYGWMDEGFTQFATNVMEDILYQSNLQNPHEGEYAGYRKLYETNNLEPLTTHSDHYRKNRNYSTSAYSRGAVFLQQLQYIIGELAFQQGMLRYFNTWKFKHPHPNDFIRVMEKTTNLDLSWYLDLYTGTIQVVDYEIDSVFANGNKTNIIIKRIGEFPMPLEILVKSNTKEELHYIPLDLLRGNKNFGSKSVILHKDWAWVYKTYTIEVDIPYSTIESVTIDPSTWLADMDLKNNNWKK